MKEPKKYKYLNYVPAPVNLDPNLYDLVDDEEFCKVDGRIPLLIATQFGIFPTCKLCDNKPKLDYSILKGLEDQKCVGFLGRGYLSEREREGIFELSLNAGIIIRIRSNKIIINLNLWDENWKLKETLPKENWK